MIFPGMKPAPLSRRKLLVRLGWGGLISFLAGSAFAIAKYFFPRVLFESPAQFKVGKPEDYLPGKVDLTFKDQQRIGIVRKEDGGFYCLSLVCTHLGCTPNWKPAEKIFHCPCHGSKFDQAGINFTGPAPRPLDRFKISLAPEGELMVDKSVTYLGLPGVDPDVMRPESVLKI